MLRYSAHLPLQGIGESGQRAIRNSHIALIGLGGLGCAAAQYLVSSGVGKLTLCDFDTVTESNLSRQVLYRHADIGRPKAVAAMNLLKNLNPDTELKTVKKRMADEDMQALFPGCDLIIDASDNYGTRLAVNRNCLDLSKPWVMASCIRMEGQIILLRPDQPDQPCYRCAYGEAPDTLEDCPGSGVFAPVAGIIGASAAHFALCFAAGMEPPPGLHLFDATSWHWQTLRVNQRKACSDCARH